MAEEKLHKEPKTKEKDQTPIIEIKDLHKTFGKDNAVLKGVTSGTVKMKQLICWIYIMLPAETFQHINAINIGLLLVTLQWRQGSNADPIKH